MSTFRPRAVPPAGSPAPGAPAPATDAPGPGPRSSAAPLALAAPDPRIAAAIAGDRRALASLATELLPRVRNVVRYLIRGDGEVDDIAQEALIAILRWLPSFRGQCALQTWVDKVTLRVTVKYVTRLRRGPRDDDADLAELPDPGARADGYALRRLAVSLLDQLPDDQREVLVMRHVLGFSVLEISEEVGVPFETVRSRLRLGMSRLRTLHESVAT